jgi:hypothetical protein
MAFCRDLRAWIESYTRVSVAQMCERVSHAIPEARRDRTDAKERWKASEARMRLALRARHESEGERQSCEDIKASITLARNNPEAEVGRAWLDYVEAKARCERLEALKETLDDASWEENP